LSSILDALKKAERESTTDRSAGTPWPAPLSRQAPSWKRTRRWWMLLGMVVGVCVLGVVLWQVRQPGNTRPVVFMSVEPSQPLSKTNSEIPLPVAEAPKPSVPVADLPTPPSAETSVDVFPRQATENASASEASVPDPTAVAVPIQPEKQPLLSATPSPEPMPAPAEDRSSRQTDSAEATDQGKTSPLNSEKVFRSDPRIDLQALVWAPDSAARFVVINNRLIKEGGSVDNIVVVRINPDDVLLAEGSDRWHEMFKIR
jgi:cytoskeletal protein RodZ